MQYLAGPHRHQHQQAGLLLLAAGLAFVAAVALSGLLTNVAQMDTILDRYVAVADHDQAYRIVNGLIGAAVLLVTVAVVRLRAVEQRWTRLDKVVLACGALAAGGWLTQVVLRATLVPEQASDIAAARATRDSAFLDQLIAGDGVFTAISILAMAALVGLAVTWYRQGLFGRPVTTVLIASSAAGAVFVRADPFANMFVPFFPFIVGLLPAGIMLLVRTRHLPRESSLDPIG